MTPITINLPPALLERARTAGILNDEAIAAILAAALDDLEDVNDPDEAVEASFQAGWSEAMTGKTHPARAVLAALKGEPPDED